MSSARDSLILIAWISAILLIGGLFWLLTRPIRTEFLQRSIDRALTAAGDERHLDSPLTGPLTPQRTFGPLSPQGYWFSLKEEENRLLFFTLIADGTFQPCAAILNPWGKVVEIIALSGRGEKALSNVSPGIIRLYIRRIEGD